MGFLGFVGASGSGGGGGSPGTPQYSVQFNNPLGTFAGDENLEWFPNPTPPSPGLLLIDQVEALVSIPAANSFTPGLLNWGHSAFGNFAQIDNLTFAPGDSVNTFNSPQAITALINEQSAGNLASTFPIGLAVYPGYKHTGVGSTSVVAVDIEPTINSDSTGPFSRFSGMNIFPTVFGSGNISQMFALFGALAISSACTVTNMAGLQYNLSASGGAAITNASTIKVTNPSFSGATVSTLIGMDIADHSGLGSVESSNIHSRGAASVNIFDGIINLGTATDASPNDGDLWYDGTHLNFRTGGSTHIIV